ncbi:hypothetical protein [Streptomyces sp. NPDC003710]
MVVRGEAARSETAARGTHELPPAFSGAGRLDEQERDTPYALLERAFSAQPAATRP